MAPTWTWLQRVEVEVIAGEGWAIDAPARFWRRKAKRSCLLIFDRRRDNLPGTFLHFFRILSFFSTKLLSGYFFIGSISNIFAPSLRFYNNITPSLKREHPHASRQNLVLSRANSNDSFIPMNPAIIPEGELDEEELNEEEEELEEELETTEGDYLDLRPNYYSSRFFVTSSILTPTSIASKFSSSSKFVFEDLRKIGSTFGSFENALGRDNLPPIPQFFSMNSKLRTRRLLLRGTASFEFPVYFSKFGGAKSGLFVENHCTAPATPTNWKEGKEEASLCTRKYFSSTSPIVGKRSSSKKEQQQHQSTPNEFSFIRRFECGVFVWINTEFDFESITLSAFF